MGIPTNFKTILFEKICDYLNTSDIEMPYSPFFPGEVVLFDQGVLLGDFEKIYRMGSVDNNIVSELLCVINRSY